MKVIVAPDKFKGSLSAPEAARAIARGVARAAPGASIDLVPMADGGEGTVEALVEATGGQYREATVTGPLGEPVLARFGQLGDGRTAVIEMAAASGLVLVPPDRRNILKASTFGTGELIRAAVEGGAEALIVGIGGSATNDGGAGMAQALGFRLLDDQGLELSPGAGPLERIERIDAARPRPLPRGLRGGRLRRRQPALRPDGCVSRLRSPEGGDPGPDRGTRPQPRPIRPGHPPGPRRRGRRPPGLRGGGGIGCRDDGLRSGVARARRVAGHRGRQARRSAPRRRPLPDGRRGDRRLERVRQDGRRGVEAGQVLRLPDPGPRRFDRTGRRGRPARRDRRLLQHLPRPDPPGTGHRPGLGIAGGCRRASHPRLPGRGSRDTEP